MLSQYVHLLDAMVVFRTGIATELACKLELMSVSMRYLRSYRWGQVDPPPRTLLVSPTVSMRFLLNTVVVVFGVFVPLLLTQPPERFHTAKPNGGWQPVTETVCLGSS